MTGRWRIPKENPSLGSARFVMRFVSASRRSSSAKDGVSAAVPLPPVTRRPLLAQHDTCFGLIGGLRRNHAPVAHAITRCRDRPRSTVKHALPAVRKEFAMTQLTDVVAATAIRPFQATVPEAELTELRRRINATKWPDRETVTDASQGVQLATIQALARYWATEYDWRTCEARLNAVPQFITEIDGL